MKTVAVDGESVLSIGEVAEKLRDALGWVSCEPCKDKCMIRFTTSDGRAFEMDGHGLSCEIDEAGEKRAEPDGRESVLIANVLNYPKTMWAHDADGKWVLVIMPYS